MYLKELHTLCFCLQESTEDILNYEDILNHEDNVYLTLHHGNRKKVKSKSAEEWAVLSKTVKCLFFLFPEKEATFPRLDF